MPTYKQSEILKDFLTPSDLRRRLDASFWEVERRLAVLGGLGGDDVIFLTSISDLSSYDDTGAQTGDIIYVLESGYYVLDRLSTETVDDFRYVLPDTGVGRWVRRNSPPEIDSVTFAVDPGTFSHVEGRVYYDSQDRTLSLMSEVPGVVLQIGQEQFVRVVNFSGDTVLNGQVVHISGALGGRPEIDLTVASTSSADRIIGLATHDIPHNTVGYVTTQGVVHDLNTSNFSEGDSVYVGMTPGELTTTRPTGENFVVNVGIVVRSHITQGAILVSIRSVPHVAQMHDVNDGTPTSGNVLVGEGSYWNSVPSSQLLSVTPVSVENSDHSVGGTSEFVSMGTRTAGRQVTLPGTPYPGQHVVVTDASGQASIYAITINGNGNNIAGSGTTSLSSDWGTVNLYFGGTIWSIV